MEVNLKEKMPNLQKNLNEVLKLFQIENLSFDL